MTATHQLWIAGTCFILKSEITQNPRTHSLGGRIGRYVKNCLMSDVSSPFLAPSKLEQSSSLSTNTTWKRNS